MRFEIMKSFGLDPEKMTQDYFKIAPFSKKRAAFYLTQAWNRACLKSGMFKPSISMLFVLKEEKIAMIPYDHESMNLWIHESLQCQLPVTGLCAMSSKSTRSIFPSNLDVWSLPELLNHVEPCWIMLNLFTQHAAFSEPLEPLYKLSSKKYPVDEQIVRLQLWALRYILILSNL